jgi:hypothetical protein
MSSSVRAALAASLLCVYPLLSGEPFHGTPVSVPGVIQAEDFDRGGLGASFFFNSTNRPVNSYRLEPSPIETVTGDGYTGRVLSRTTRPSPGALSWKETPNREANFRTSFASGWGPISSRCFGLGHGQEILFAINNKHAIYRMWYMMTWSG